MCDMTLERLCFFSPVFSSVNICVLVCDMKNKNSTYSSGFCLVLLLLFLRMSCSPGWSGAHYVDYSVLKLVAVLAQAQSPLKAGITIHSALLLAMVRTR